MKNFKRMGKRRKQRSKKVFPIKPGNPRHKQDFERLLTDAVTPPKK